MLNKQIVIISFIILQVLIMLFIYHKQKRKFAHKNTEQEICIMDILMGIFLINLNALIPSFLFNYFRYRKAFVYISPFFCIVTSMYILYVLFIKYRNNIKVIIFGDTMDLSNSLWFIRLFSLIIMFNTLIPGFLIRNRGLEYYIHKVFLYKDWFRPLKYIHFNYQHFILPTILLGVIIVPIIEELLYRKMLYGYLKKLLDLKIAFVLALALFYLLHYSIYNINIIFWGCIYLWIYEKTKAVFYCILAHIAKNISLGINYFLWVNKSNYHCENILIFIGLFAIIVFVSIIILQRKHSNYRRGSLG